MWLCLNGLVRQSYKKTAHPSESGKLKISIQNHSIVALIVCASCGTLMLEDSRVILAFS